MTDQIEREANLLITWTYQNFIAVDEMPKDGWHVRNLDPKARDLMNKGEQDLYDLLMKSKPATWTKIADIDPETFVDGWYWIICGEYASYSPHYMTRNYFTNIQPSTTHIVRATPPPAPEGEG